MMEIHAWSTYLCIPVRVPSMALRRERIALAHMPRMSASSARARVRTRTQEHTHVPIHMPGLGIDIYIYIYIVHEVCVRYIYRRTYPRAHMMVTAASSARAIARTCAFEAVQQHARPNPSLTQVHIYLYTHVICIHIYTYTHTHTHTHTHRYTYVDISCHCYMQLYLHTWTPAHARAHTSAHATGARARRSRCAQRPAPHRRPAERVPPCRAGGPKRRRIPIACSTQTRCSTRRCSR
jgi:hypothetical protein